MNFLTQLDAHYQKVNFLANLFDHKESQCSLAAPNCSKRTLSFAMAMTMVSRTSNSTPLRTMEVQEHEAENDEFECALIYLVTHGVETIVMDDAEHDTHPLWEYLTHPIIGEHITTAKISLNFIGRIQNDIFAARTSEPRNWEKEMEAWARWEKKCIKMSLYFTNIVLEGSDTMLFPAEGRPKVLEAALPVHHDMKRELAFWQLMHSRERASIRKLDPKSEPQVGSQSFRQLNLNEEVIRDYVPPRWGLEESMTNWGQAAHPPYNSEATIGRPRAEACGVWTKVQLP